MKYDKIILACNNDECDLEYIHMLIKAGTFEFIQEDMIPCSLCGIYLTFCERIEEAGDL